MRQVNLDFLNNAPVRATGDVLINQPTAAVFDALAVDPGSWWRWYPGFGKGGHYLGDAPYGVDSVRQMTVAGQTVLEKVLAWDDQTRWAFFIAQARMPGIRALAEDYQLIDQGASTLLRWTLAMDLGAVSKLSRRFVNVTANRMTRTAAKRLERYLGSVAS